jgi:hypothetical protein
LGAKGIDKGARCQKSLWKPKEKKGEKEWREEGDWGEWSGERREMGAKGR